MTPLVLMLGSLSLAAPQAPSERTTEGTVRQLTACAGPSLQSFLRLPTVRSVGPCVTGASEAEKLSQTLCIHEFAKAAHFPLPRYDLVGNFDSRDGLLIYEGMRLSVNPSTGVYDVEFTATVPSTPVTVHLQLLFTPRIPHHQFECYRLTLPPIRLEPPTRAALGDPSVNTFHVNHRGYFFLFQRTSAAKAGPSPLDLVGWDVGRTGTARFGTPVAVDDLGR